MEDEKIDVSEMMDKEMSADTSQEEGEKEVATPTTEEKQPEERDVGNEGDTPKHIPYNRFQEVVQEKNMLKSMLENYQRILEQQLQPKQVEEEEIIDPVVKNIKNDTQQLKQAIGTIMDKQDLLEARSVIPNYDKVAVDVEGFRAEMMRRGMPISRVDAYTYLLGKGVIKPHNPQPKQKVVAKQTEEEKATPIPPTKPAQPNKGKPTSPNEIDIEALKNIKF